MIRNLLLFWFACGLISIGIFGKRFYFDIFGMFKLVPFPIRSIASVLAGGPVSLIASFMTSDDDDEEDN